jgi:hypothetical protein
MSTYNDVGDYLYDYISDDATRVVLQSKTYINANYIDVSIHYDVISKQNSNFVETTLNC